MTTPMTGNERLKALKLNAVKAAYYLEIDAAIIAAAGEEQETPTWLSLCLDAMEAEASEDPDAFMYLQLGSDVQGDGWTEITARQAIPVLIAAAKERRTMSYAELDEELRRLDPTRGNAGILTKYGRPLGRIGEVIDHIRLEARAGTGGVPKEYENIPPIEVLVTGGRTGIPGANADFFLKTYMESQGQADIDNLLLTDRKRLYIQAQEDVWAFPIWDLLLKFGDS